LEKEIINSVCNQFKLPEAHLKAIQGAVRNTGLEQRRPVGTADTDLEPHAFRWQLKL
jgi:hypothetical protein